MITYTQVDDEQWAELDQIVYVAAQDVPLTRHNKTINSRVKLKNGDVLYSFWYAKDVYKSMEAANRK